MAEATFDYGWEVIAKQNVEAVTAGDRLRALLTMTNFDFDTDQAKATLSACSLDELDGSGYSRADMTLTVAVDTVNHKVTISQANDEIGMGTISNGTRLISGAIVYYDPDGTDVDSQNVPLWWFPLASSQNPGGQPVVFQFASPMKVLKDLPAI